MSHLPDNADPVVQAPLIDRVTLAQLQDLECNDQFVRQLIQTFIRDAQSYFQTLHEAAERQALGPWRDACHNITAAAGSIGAARLSRHCAKQLNNDPCNQAAYLSAFGRAQTIYRDTLTAFAEQGLLE